MRGVRRCRRPGCENPAVATLTSVYADSTIVIGPLATERQPEAYDLCARHVESFTAPRGWQVIRLATSFEPAPPSDDDLTALAEAVRDASRSPRPRPQPAERAGRPSGIVPASLTGAGPIPPTLPDHLAGLGDGEILRRGHLRVLRGDKED
ncbi:DUF3499 domain-containing protein [Actinomyces sp. W5033]|uniref:DUF3499 domain-containing protein n=1 Tax=Actinomyces sp. W5033 TaxID=3446479 RepID=UPI003EDF5EB7